MFKNMKLAMKLTLGFGVVVAILVVLGVTGYLMFSKVNTNVEDLGKNNLPSVKHSTGVEREAFNCILQEKNYILTKDDKFHDTVKKNLGDLFGNLDKVDAVAKEYNNTALADKSREVRKISTDYGKLYDDGVAAFKSNGAGATLMQDKGQLVSDEARGYLAAKKAEYLEAKDALAIVNDINANALDTRMNEKAYMIYKDAKYFKAIETNIGELLTAYDQLEKLHPDSGELKQIADARKATKDYFEAAKLWVAKEKSSVEATAVMEKTSQAVIDNANAFIDNKMKDYKAAIGTTKTDEAARAYNLIVVCNKVLDYANLAIIFSKKYMLESKPEYWKNVTSNIDELNKVFAELRKSTNDEKDLKMIETAEKATAEYLAAAKAWVDNDTQMKAAATTMDNGGQTVGKAAADYLAAKQKMVNTVADAVFVVSAIDQTAYRIRLREKEYMLAPNEKTWTDMTGLLADLNKLYGDLSKVSTTEIDKQRIEKATKATAEYAGAAKSWVDNDAKLRTEILPQMKKIGESVLATAQSAENDAWGKADVSNTTVMGVVASSKVIIVIVLLVGAIVGFGAAFGVTRSITTALNRVIAGLSSGAEQVTAASGQVASASQQMAQGASEQASSLEETSASLEEMASMTNQNADNANQANVVAKQAAQLAETGVESMKEMQLAIDRIKNSASETAKIIKTIDEIAFQTNLLALNAAVEAARAGEAGKGFAVVAEEVRNLARRSAEAAKNTADLIEGSQKNADAGVKVTAEVAKNLAGIKENAGKVATLIAEIAAASKEQSQGIGQVTTAVAEMDKVVQQNAANAEESASAAEELSSQAEEVNGMVSELSAMVTGSATVATGQRQLRAARTTPAMAQSAHKALPAAHKAPAFAKNKARPEAVIPLDDKDLKEF